MSVTTLITIANPVRGYQLETRVGQHINVYNNYDAVQIHAGSIKKAGVAKRTFKNALNVKVKLPFWRRDIDIFGIPNHSIMHSNIKTWKKYIEPRLINKFVGPI
jgi:hypothetical protein